ncbi:scavenger receptor class F member 1-like, partial [Saccostrea cucullata]|uniref:scavenger receptor class F member 1-like n=1 Tax=Saccostrea cuccullata TaxID=36930 RepID=UPI002ED3B40C
SYKDQLVIPGHTWAISSSVDYGGYPNKTVDGDVSQNSYTYCMHTAGYESEAWLMIDLGKIDIIKSVKFWYRNDSNVPGYNTRRIQGFNIRLSNTTQTDRQDICYQDDGKTILPPIIEQQCKGVAQFVWIYTNKTFIDGAVLEICEVQVYGKLFVTLSYILCIPECPKGVYGEGCQEQCGNCEVDRACHHINGSCPGLCEPGYLGDRCQIVCNKGFYGKGCLEKCGHCDNNQCHHINGSCSGFCKSGYQGYKCDRECPKGVYGEGCQEQCGYCEGDRACHHIDGSCPGLCEPGYLGERCQNVCNKGFYGKGCLEKCGHCDNSQCHHINGSCSGFCKSGYQGYKCDRACNPDWYGRECKEKCGYCRHESPCHPVTGSCSGLCEPGYSGDTIDI